MNTIENIINEVVNNGCKIYNPNTDGIYEKIDSLNEEEYSLLQDALEKSYMYIEYRNVDDIYVVF